MRGNNPPSGVNSLLREVLKGLGLESRVKEQTCILVWDEVVGEQVSSAAQPEFIKDGKLFVVTKSPVWANELNFYKADMIVRLNRRVGANAVKDIIFKAGRVLPKETKTSAAETEEPGLEGIQLTDLELETLETAARSAGEEASGVVADLMATALRLDKWKKVHGWTPCKVCGTLQNTASGVCPVCGIEPR